jgi:hypothetical protein
MEGMIHNMKLAFRIQINTPEIVDISKESQETLDLNGIGGKDADKIASCRDFSDFPCLWRGRRGSAKGSGKMGGRHQGRVELFTFPKMYLVKSCVAAQTCFVLGNAVAELSGSSMKVFPI